MKQEWEEPHLLFPLKDTWRLARCMMRPAAVGGGVGGAGRVGVASNSPGFKATSSYICAMAGLPSLSDPLALGP